MEYLIPFPIISFTLCHSELRYESVFLSRYFAALNMTKCKVNCGNWYDFLARGLEEGLPMFEYPNGGELGLFEPKTNTFGVYNPDGTTSTFFKPTSPTYFERHMKDAVNRGGRVINPLPLQKFQRYQLKSLLFLNFQFLLLNNNYFYNNT
jgi:hypothetical protein